MAKKKQAPAEERFGKRAILRAMKYRQNETILEVILKDDQTYTLKEVDDLLERTLKGKVK